MIPRKKDKLTEDLLNGLPSEKELAAPISFRQRQRQIDELVFSAGRYDWYVYDNDSPTTYTNTVGKRSVTFNKGDEFGLRKANSKPGMWRMISKTHGETIVFSLTTDEINTLKSKADPR